MLILFAVLGSYNKQHRDASIEADLNKLYDTRPTSGSIVHDAYSRNLQQKSIKMPENGHNSSPEDNEERSAVPYFDLNHSGNVTGVLGKTAHLNCRVKNVGNKTVSTKSFKHIILPAIKIYILSLCASLLAGI